MSLNMFIDLCKVWQVGHELVQFTPHGSNAWHRMWLQDVHVSGKRDMVLKGF